MAAAIIGGLGAAATGYAWGRLRPSRLTGGSQAQAEPATVPSDD
jgi:hypothetical protein